MIRRIFLSSLIVAVFIMSLALPVTASPKVIIDGSTISFDVLPRIEQGTTLVPLRGVFEALGASVSWDANTKTINATKGDIELRLTVGSKNAYRNGTLVLLPVPSKVVEGSTLVPLRFVSEALGADISWDKRTGTIFIQSGGQPQPPAVTKEFLTWPDGTTYSGDILNGQPHGYGTMTWPSGQQFTGTFSYGKRHGEGTLTEPKSTYSGQWINDKPHGQGKLILYDGTQEAWSFEGEFAYGLPNGYGSSRSNLGITYDGQWKDGKWHGLGKMVYPDGSIYVGEWANAEPHGQGTLTFYNGLVLSGTWVNGNPPPYPHAINSQTSQPQPAIPQMTKPSIDYQQDFESIKLAADRQRDLVQRTYGNEKRILDSQKEKELEACAVDAERRGLLFSGIFESMKQEILDKYDNLYEQLKNQRDRQLSEIDAWEISAIRQLR